MSSSSEEDGDAAWKAAISSAAAGATSYINSLSAKPTQLPAQDSNPTKLPKHYQIKAQKLLDDIVGKSLEIVHSSIPELDDEAVSNEEEAGVRLFKNAPRGIVFDHKEEQAPRKRPRILPGKEINEKSKKFKQRIQSVAVDGNDIVSEAKYRCQIALSRLEAKEAAAKEAAKREEERVVDLKKVRGERWLPSIAKEMQSKRGSSEEAAKREEERVAQLNKGERCVPSIAREMQFKGRHKK
ncbi:PREDICTED: uncharacterized protein LOC101312672 [Fragaria vesca subsp. vesca]|uniref:uncharacterized protein LOC101312672 n=1 Tax=Fragaria vesca subsp. vesca TaxID=101020 RepID=UPI0002C336C8|nr:PREDICTED: uncharacterized protein LOC101312672 [Fragaria vesca subsp. vesca]